MLLNLTLYLFIYLFRFFPPLTLNKLVWSELVLRGRHMINRVPSEMQPRAIAQRKRREKEKICD